MATAAPAPAAAAAPPLAPPSAAVVLPLADVAAGTTWHRITAAAYGPIAFNPKSEARFSPVLDAAGLSVPVMYLGTDWDTSLMETVFHSVSLSPTVRHYNMAALVVPPRVAVEVQLAAVVKAIDLTGLGLTAAGAGQALTRCFPVDYPITRQWAQALYDSNPGAHGILWTSRQNDNGKCLMLFADRCAAARVSLSVAAKPVALEDKVFVAAHVHRVARLAGIRLLPATAGP